MVFWSRKDYTLVNEVAVAQWYAQRNPESDSRDTQRDISYLIDIEAQTAHDFGRSLEQWEREAMFDTMNPSLPSQEPLYRVTKDMSLKEKVLFWTAQANACVATIALFTGQFYLAGITAAVSGASMYRSARSMNKRLGPGTASLHIIPGRRLQRALPPSPTK